MASNQNIFINYKIFSLSQHAYTIDCTSNAIQGIGNVQIILSNGIQKIIPDVLHVFNLRCNLFSVKQLAIARGNFSIQGCTATLYNSKTQLIATCHLDNDLYILGHSISHNLAHNVITPNTLRGELALNSTSTDLIINWHKRLGHVNFPRLQELVNNNLVEGINLKYITKTKPFCESCIIGKQHKLSFPKILYSRTSHLLDLNHSNIKGKITPTHIETHYGRKIKALRSDEGDEYISDIFQTFVLNMAYIETSLIHIAQGKMVFLKGKIEPLLKLL